MPSFKIGDKVTLKNRAGYGKCIFGRVYTIKEIIDDSKLYFSELSTWDGYWYKSFQLANRYEGDNMHDSGVVQDKRMSWGDSMLEKARYGLSDYAWG